MTSRPRFLSWRALLKIAAASTLAPFALSPYGRAELEATAATLFSDKDKRMRFFKAAEKLWKHFEDGVQDVATEKDVEITIGPGVFEEAIARSGGALIKNINCFKDDGDEVDGDSTKRCVNACAVASAGAAADVAGSPKIITVDIFTTKWDATKALYGAKVCKTNGGSGPSASSPPMKSLAFGCA